MIKKLLLLVSFVFLSLALNAQETNCNDGIDNDNDGLIDCLDPDCPSCAFAQNCSKPYLYYMPPMWLDANGFNGQTGKPSDVIIATFGSTATVTIGTPDGSWSQTLVVPVGNPANVTIPNNVIAFLTANTVINKNGGFIVSSNQPLQVTYRLLSFYNQDIVSLYGPSSLGFSFYPGSQTDLEPSQFNSNERHFVSILATENNTTIKLKNPMALEGIAAGTTTTITLNAGQSYIVTSPQSAPNTSISGVKVTSDKPIVVNGGSQHTNTPQGSDYDAGIEQVIPAHLTGTTYVGIDAGNPNTVKDYLTIIAIENATEIQVNNQPVANLSAGQVYTYFFDNTINKSYTVTSANKFYCYHHATYGGAEFGTGLLPPVNPCIGSLKVDFERPGTEAKAFVVIPNSGLSSLKFKGQPYTNFATATAVTNLAGYSYVIIPNTAIEPVGNNNRIESNAKFNVGVVSRSGGTGNYGYYSNYNAEVSILDPNTGSPTSFIDGGNVTPGVAKQLCVQLSSCGSNNKITSTIPSVNTASLTNNDNCITYTMNANAPDCARDTVALIASNELGLTGRVCVVFSNINQRISNVNIVPNNPSICAAGTGGNSSVTLTASATSPDGIASYKWLTPAGVTVTGANQTVTLPGVYTLTITNNAGCFIKRTLTVASKNCADNDGDGVNDNVDIDDDNDGILDVNEGNGSVDTDGDGVPDSKDRDSDNDGIPDVAEVGGVDANGDGVIDCTISATTGLANCLPATGLPNLDSDGDGKPNSRDLDSDNDGITDIIEVRGGDADFNGIQDNFLDTDGDGFNDNVDFSESGSPSFVTGLDANGDGKADNYPQGDDRDNDGKPNYLDIDADNDGIVDNIESQNSNTPGAYTPPAGADSDNDGIDDAYDNINGFGGSGNNPLNANTDGGSAPDYVDTDSDNDGDPDAIEGWDANNDGVADVVKANADADNDGLDDAYDNNDAAWNPTNGTTPASYPNKDNPATYLQDWRDNTVQLIDSDGDGKPDVSDLDDDNDGVKDVLENDCALSLQSANFNFNATTVTTPVNGYTDIQNGIQLKIKVTKTPNTVISSNTFDDHYTNAVNPGKEIRLANFGPTKADYSRITYIFNKPIANLKVKAFDIDANGSATLGDSLVVIPYFKGQPVPYGPSDVITSIFNSYFPPFTFIGAGGNALPPDTNGDISFKFNFLLDSVQFSFRNRDLITSNSFGVSAPLQTLCNTDNDGDGIPNSIDVDSDNDGITDIIENFGIDADGNGEVDGFTDTDNDGLADKYDGNNGGTDLTLKDFDGDTRPNFIDIDSDNDGITDIVEVRGDDFTTNSFNGIVDGNTDVDKDGLLDAVDPQIGNSSSTGIPICISQDLNNDGKPDTWPQDNPDNDLTNPIFLDIDADNDGIIDNVEAQTTVGFIAPGTFTDANKNGLNDIYETAFVKGLNPLLANSDGGSAPDYTDRDSDNDGANDALEGWDTDGDGIANTLPGTVDANGNGLLDGYETAGNPTNVAPTDRPDVNKPGGDRDWRQKNDFDGDGISDDADLDDDNDGILDAVEGTADTDGDGNPDNRDIDADNDGIVDYIEAQVSGAPITPGTADADQDGILDAFDSQSTQFGGNGLTPVNTDGADNPDYKDLDSDNDTKTDLLEGGFTGTLTTTDIDNDGLLDIFPDNNTTAVNPTNGQTSASFPNLENSATPELDWREKLDFDGDGVSDAVDPDDDNDGILDTAEGNGDSDGDGNPDSKDLDSDNDGIPDVAEAGGVDVNGDGIIDCPITVATGLASCLTSAGLPSSGPTWDSDGDGVPNIRDLDSDNDGITDIAEVGGSALDSDGDGRIDNPTDTDNDGLADLVDPTNPTPTAAGTPIFTTGPDATGNDGLADSYPTDNTDGDSKPNFLDLDSDNDGITDVIEAGGTDANGDGIIDGFTDPNGNGLADVVDPSAAGAGIKSPLSNPDFDGDGIPNTLDLDSDNDGILDIKEVGGTDANNDGKIDNFVDTNKDGLSDPLLTTPIIVTGTDTNGDGRPNTYPIADNQDNTGGPNFLDIDADDDGIVDNIEGQTTTGYIALTGLDTDGDGIDNAYDGAATITPTNTDGQDNPDYLDTDSDNDGLSDLIEGHDFNGDGTPDTVPTGADADKDGLDDAFDNNDAAPIVANGETPSSFPNIDKPLTTERDWREVTDTDGDGISDVIDLDDDNDGVPDSVEGNGDKDGDGLPDSKDLDSDNDGIPDITENGAPDTDKDGKVDNFVDTNGDGLSDPLATNPIAQLDSDGDGKPNQDDLDSDNDGITDVIEAGGQDPDGNGQIGTGFGSTIPDADNDGLADAVDPKNGIVTNPAATPLPIRNTDNTGKPDYLDIDADDDGIVDNIEGQPTLGYIPPTGTDLDGDGIDNAYDNNNGFGGSGLTNLPNSDNGGTPDYRDLDSDNDGISDIIEKGGAASGGTTDADGDGLLDGFDSNTATPTSVGSAINVTNGNLTPSSYPNTQKPSTNERDWREGTTDPDFDGDGVVDILDLDDDNDGIPDSVEGNSDTDGDGQPDSKDRDSDNDGIPDTIENGTLDPDGDGVAGSGPLVVNTNGEVLVAGNPIIVTPKDFDGDGKPNYLDLDSDNDGITDVIEAGGSDPDGNGQIGTGIPTDTDGDGLADVVDGTKLPLPNTDASGGLDYLDIDADNDGIVDNIEAQTTIGYVPPSGNDVDNDGIDDAYDNNPLFGGAGIIVLSDVDGTGGPDYVDTDSDGDGATDIQENGTNVAPNGTDSDGDGLDNAFDANNGTGNPLGNPSNVTNGNQTPNSFPNTQNIQTPERDWRDASTPLADFDSDNIPDGTDLDDDNDGVPDSVEGTADTDGDGNPDSRDLDSDNDGIPDTIENGVADPDKDGVAGAGTLVVNGSGQVLIAGNPINVTVPLDQDQDGKPNYLDLDSDNDGITDVIEAGGSDPDGNGQIGTGNGAGIPDADNDGLADEVDPKNPTTVSVGNPLPNPNTDGIGQPNYLDIDSDDDGIVDNIEGQGTFTYIAPTGTLTSTDTDGDGINDAYDNFVGFGGNGINPANTDGTGQPDYKDLDTDDDGNSDITEKGGATIGGLTDTDNDGLLDGFENAAVTGPIGAPSNVTNANILAGVPNFPNNQNPTTPEKDWRDTTVPTLDFDLDGIPDVFDADDDNDGILDTDEGNGLTDTDGDGNPDSQDRDSDNDGIPDTIENGLMDVDKDGIADGNDSDNDGLLDQVDPTNGGTPVTPKDFDGDGKPNYLDLDSDNDGITDIIEAGGSDPDGNGQVGSISGPNFPDADNDGLGDPVDPTSGSANNGSPLAIPNTDVTGGPNYLDIDADNDGIVDNIEAQPTAGYLAPSGTDTDGDGIDNIFDLSNGFGGSGINPVNTDGSDTPDYIDIDSDNDALPDNTENGKPIPPSLTADTDNDGLLDGYDTVPGGSILGSAANVTNGQTPITSSPNTQNTVTPERDWREFKDSDGDGISNNIDLDDDNDGILDTDEAVGDSDGDNLEDSLDTDSDNDGIPDVVEAGGVDANGDGKIDCPVFGPDGLADCLAGNTGLGNPDFDGDGKPNSLDIDADNDGITDVREAGGTDLDFDGKNDAPGSILQTGIDANGDGKPDTYPNDNADGTGKPNYLDIDADDDGIPDNIEAQATNAYIPPSGLDTDGDGLDNAYEATSPATATGKGLIPVNTDGTFATGNDLIPDYLDTNSDGDALSDIQENGFNQIPSGVDTDGDGLDNAFERNPAISSNLGTKENVTNITVPTFYPNLQNGSTTERDWRDPTILVTPVVVNEVISTFIGTSITANILANDGPVGVTTGAIVNNVNSGIATITNGVLTYTPNGGFIGYDTLVVSVCIGTPSVCVNDTVFITVKPRIIKNAVSTTINTNVSGDASTTNNPNSGLVYNPASVTVVGASNGSLVVNPNGTFTFSPNTGFTGTTTYNVSVCLNTVNPPICQTDTIIINVNAPGVPTVNDETANTLAGTAVVIPILANDAPNTVTLGNIVNPVNNGTTLVNGGNVTYTPNPNFIGYDTLVIQVCLPAGSCLNDTVFITVRPRILKDVKTTPLNTAVSGNANNTNTPSSGLVFGTPVALGTANGSITMSPNGAFTYTPSNGFIGTVQYLVQVCANSVVPPLCANDTIVITVLPGDRDGDSVVDNVDVDDDNDGIPDVIENDSNGDGIVNAQDNPDVDGDGIPNSLDIDSDNDGITDVKETGGVDTNNDGQVDGPVNTTTGQIGTGIVTPINTDGTLGNGIAITDKFPDFLDIDSDNDGIVDIIEGQSTLGYIPPTGNDTDKDGLDNAYDNSTTFGGSGIAVTNTDGTDKPDYQDADSDNDGKSDISENGDNTPAITNADIDKDGLLDGFDNITNPVTLGSPTNVTNNNQTPNNFPNDQVASTPERDWRESDAAPVVDVVIPTGYTPDDANPKGMIIVGIDAASEAEIVIFNRWGNVVYKTNDYTNNPWKGQNEGDLTFVKNKVNTTKTNAEIVPEGTYFYILTYKKNGEKKNKQGYVYIKY
jgi:IgGFc binding protein/CHU_C Type IX secretion signal domain